MKYLLIATSILIAAAHIPTAASFAQSFLHNNSSSNNSNQRAQSQSANSQSNQSSTNSSVINQYDPKYRSQAMAAFAKNSATAQNIILSNDYDLRLSKPTELEGRIVNLDLKYPITLAPCSAVTFPNVRTQMRKDAFVIKVDGNLEGQPESNPACNTSPSPTISVPINLDDLESARVSSIILETPRGKTTFSISSESDSVSFADKSGGRAPLQQNFHNEKTVILQIPGAADIPDLEHKIRLIAATYGLSPAKGKPSKNEFYFTDEGGLLSLSAAGNQNIKLDTIQIDDIFHGANGLYTVKRKIDIFARRPGRYD